MIHRIIQAFTVPKLQQTFLDEFIAGLTVVGILVIFYLLYLLVLHLRERQHNHD